MIFFVGLHHPGDARHFSHAFISVNALRKRHKAVRSKVCWIMDSGAFTELSTHGRYRSSPQQYAYEINRWVGDNMLAAVSQDYMCEPFIVEKTGLSVAQHQQKTIERFDILLPLVRHTYLMPVLQGYTRNDYLQHLSMYDTRLGPAAWVGVGSICKRNGDPRQIHDILSAIKRQRPDLRLHGFGLKLTSLAFKPIRDLLYTADSMAWSYRARIEGRNPNDRNEAHRFVDRINTLCLST